MREHRGCYRRQVRVGKAEYRSGEIHLAGRTQAAAELCMQHRHLSAAVHGWVTGEYLLQQACAGAGHADDEQRLRGGVAEMPGPLQERLPEGLQYRSLEIQLRARGIAIQPPFQAVGVDIVAEGGVMPAGLVQHVTQCEMYVSPLTGLLPFVLLCRRGEPRDQWGIQRQGRDI
jgi:hypothetical protein